MMAPNLWAIMLSITLFTLGVDSAFSMVEATATVICDTKWGKQFPRAFVAFLLCLLGFVLSIPFCTNWGFFLLDVVDHYLANYLLILVGILQCAGCGWGFDVERTHEKSAFHEKSLKYLTKSFWLIVILFGIIFPSVK
jgi:SNF family Na+-dependent transporter